MGLAKKHQKRSTKLHPQSRSDCQFCSFLATLSFVTTPHPLLFLFLTINPTSYSSSRLLFVFFSFLTTSLSSSVYSILHNTIAHHCLTLFCLADGEATASAFSAQVTSSDDVDILKNSSSPKRPTISKTLIATSSLIIDSSHSCQQAQTSCPGQHQIQDRTRPDR